jgi:hypothetical protein
MVWTFYRVLAMVYSTQNYWIFGLSPSSVVFGGRNKTFRKLVWRILSPEMQRYVQRWKSIVVSEEHFNRLNGVISQKIQDFITIPLKLHPNKFKALGLLEYRAVGCSSSYNKESLIATREVPLLQSALQPRPLLETNLVVHWKRRPCFGRHYNLDLCWKRIQ